MFSQEEKAKFYLLNVVEGLAGAKSNTRKKEEKRKLLMTELVSGSIK